MPVTINGSGGFTANDGSAAAPSIAGTDSNTGVFFPAADTVAIATGGSERARVDSSGNVGIGTSSPGAKLQVTGSASNAIAVFDKGAANQAYTQLKNSSQSYSTYVDINNNGTNWLAQYDTTNAQLIDVYVPTSYRAFYTAGSERARITSGGRLNLGTTGGSATRLEIEGGETQCAFINTSATDANYKTTMAFTDSGGTTRGTIRVNNSATQYNTSSDYRLKENIAPMTGALAKVSALKPCTFNWKIDGTAGEGFIAHELAEVVPDAVAGEKDAVETYTDKNGNEQTRPVYQGIDTSFLVATLTAALQELTAKLDAAEARIAALEGAQA